MVKEIRDEFALLNRSPSPQLESNMGSLEIAFLKRLLTDPSCFVGTMVTLGTGMMTETGSHPGGGAGEGGIGLDPG